MLYEADGLNGGSVHSSTKQYQGKLTCTYCRIHRGSQQAVPLPAQLLSLEGANFEDWAHKDER